MDIEIVRKIEHQILKVTVNALLESGLILSVIDSESVIVYRTKNKEKVLCALQLDCENTIHCYKDEQLVGDISFVYGNQGFDVIQHYSDSIKSYLSLPLELSEYLKERKQVTH